MTLLAVFLVYAADLPARQPPPAPVEGECVAEAPVRIGERPAFVATDGRATCRGVLVGTSTYTDLLASQDDAEMVRALYRVDEATWQDDRASAALREAYWREIAARPQIEPVVYIGVGVVAGVVLTVAAGWAVGQVAGP